MCENNNNETVPGFILRSQNFTLKFVAGFQNGTKSYLLEYESDWTEVMFIILENLNRSPSSLKMVGDLLEKSLDEWFSEHEVADDVKASVQIGDTVHLNPSRKSIYKRLTVSFSDNTRLVFNVNKRRRITTLIELGAEVVVENIRVEQYIMCLPVPAVLFPDLDKAFRNEFCMRHYQDKVKRLANHRRKL